MKKWLTRCLHSKTMIAAALLDVLGVIQANTDFLSTVMAPHSFGWVMLSIGVLMKVLRWVTTQPMVDK